MARERPSRRRWRFPMAEGIGLTEIIQPRASRALVRQAIEVEFLRLRRRPAE